jgi:hypothetical protein
MVLYRFTDVLEELQGQTRIQVTRKRNPCRFLLIAFGLLFDPVDGGIKFLHSIARLLSEYALKVAFAAASFSPSGTDV